MIYLIYTQILKTKIDWIYWKQSLITPKSNIYDFTFYSPISFAYLNCTKKFSSAKMEKDMYENKTSRRMLMSSHSKLKLKIEIIRKTSIISKMFEF